MDGASVYESQLFVVRLQLCAWAHLGEGRSLGSGRGGAWAALAAPRAAPSMARCPRPAAEPGAAPGSP